MDNQQKDNQVIRTGLEIAVIGMAGRFPGAKNIREFWQNLKDGIESVSFLTDEEIVEKKINLQWLKNPNYVRSKGGFLEEKEYFDASFFDYTAVEAEVMDPQFRIFHQCAWHALEHAGYNPYTYDGMIGLYAGSSSHLYWQALAMLSGNVAELGEFAFNKLIDRAFLCMKISYKLNLKGPALVMQSACSTSLVAIHTACQAILNGECHIALAGGVTISSEPEKGYFYQEGMIHSPDGHLRAFDIRARGAVFGNGAGIVVLKLLEEAINDGDHIHAVVLGSAINNDGNRKSGFTAPAREGQTEVIRAAQLVAEVDPESITFIEAHGTGTTLGDPIEIEALTRAFNTDKKGYCAIGSVKTNVGHLDSAAGVTGFIKTVLALEHRQIPASLNYTTPNPMIDFEQSPFYVNTKLKDWKNDKFPLRAGVSSFGIGGTNAHVIIEEPPKAEESTGSKKWQLLLLSARTESSLEQITSNLAEYFKENPNVSLADVSYTLMKGRGLFEYKRMLVCESVKEATTALDPIDGDKVKTYYAKPEKSSVVFMFSGQGSQYVNMARDIYQNEPIFQKELDSCFEILNPILGYDIKKTLYPETLTIKTGSNNEVKTVSPSDNSINQTVVAQPLLFAIEYSLAQLLIGWGITPFAMIGHSIGEYVAATLAGVFSKEEALELVALRGQLMQKMPGGSMLSIPLPGEEVIPMLNDHIALAAINDPTSCVVSGPHSDIDHLEKKMRDRGYDCKRLHTSHAFHSPMMDPILKEFQEKLKELSLKRPTIPFISNISGQWITANQAVDPQYWSRHLRQPVRFFQGIETLKSEGATIFLEVGPGNVLSHYARKQQNKSKQLPALNLIRHPKEISPDDKYLINKIGMMWLYGKTPDWNKFYAAEKRKRIPLPIYPFNGKRFWIDGDPSKMLSINQSKPQLVKKQDIAEWFYLPGWEPSLFPIKSFVGSRGGFSKEPLAAGGESGRACWLLFLDNCGIGAQLKIKLQQEGQRVITVKKSSTFSHSDNDEYTINVDTGDSSDYEKLFNQLGEQKKIPVNIVHLWGITRANSEKDQSRELGFEDVNNSLNLGFFSLLFLVRALDKQQPGHDIKIGVVTNDLYNICGEEVLYPEKSTVLGAMKVIPQEYPYIKCSHIDIRLPKPGINGEEKIIHWIYGEFLNEFSGSVIAYRNNQRLEQSFVPVKWADNSETNTKLRPNGVYLITGGLGNIGLLLAEYLASRVKARLILTSRSPFPARDQWEQWQEKHSKTDKISIKIDKIKKIEELGAEVLTKSADVVDILRMKQVVAQAEERFGTINGVIHAAGIVGEESRQGIAFATISDCFRQFKPKILGTMVLDNIFGRRKLDFCILTSSLASVIGGLGFLAYSAANIFMDVFVQFGNKNTSFQWSSINWDGWDFNVSKEGKRGLDDNVDPTHLGIGPNEGIAVFNRIFFAETPTQIVVSSGDLALRIERWINLTSLKETKEDLGKNKKRSFQPRPNLTSSFVAPQNDMEHKMADIWQHMFGLDRVGIHDNFFELGGDSLQVIQLVRKLNAADISISVDKIYINPTISKLYCNLQQEEEVISNESTKSVVDPEVENEIKENDDNDDNNDNNSNLNLLKKELSDQEREEIIEEINKNEELFNWAKDNQCTRKYEVSPIQRHYLANAEATAKNILIYSYEFSSPLDIPGIKNIVIQILNENSLFRSIIRKETDHYHINEFAELIDINLPFIDMSRYDPESLKDVKSIVEENLRRPFQLLDRLLYRIILVKTDKTKYSLFFILNHIIFDGESMLVLTKQIDHRVNLVKGNSENQNRVKNEAEYFTYTAFLQDQTYENIKLENHLDMEEYLEYLDKIPRKPQKKYAEEDVFKIDISQLKPFCKDFYYEILLLSYAKLMSQFYEIDKVPLIFYSNGRNYKDANFRDIIGAFHDGIPVLLTFSNNSNFKEMLENFLDYRKFIRSSNLNFANFIVKNYYKGIDYSKALHSPFIFNPQVGLYQRFENLYKERTIEEPGQKQEFKSLRLDMTMSKELGSDNLLVRFLHNSKFNIEDLKNEFIENYSQLVNFFNANSIINV